jgi:D-alanyl-D-alanine carboxypeptidase
MALGALHSSGGEVGVRVAMSKKIGHPGARQRRFGFGGGVALSALAVWLISAMPALAYHWQGGGAGYAPVFEWLVLDAETGQVLGEQNSDQVTYPASLTKLMTLYLTFQQLNKGTITLEQRFSVSAYAASRAPSKLGLRPGDTVSVHDLILGIVTKSANDAATVLAEGLAGSEARFAQYMNWTAHQLGMEHSWYQNASGLPDPQQRTTARDIARLALAIYQQFPREYHYFNTREFDFRGEIVHSHNHILDWYQGADGLKTGFVDASGFNLAASAVRNGHRLIGVIMGGRTARTRDVQMASLLDQGFTIVSTQRPAAPATPATTMVAAASPAPAMAPVAAAPATVAAIPTARPASVPTVAAVGQPASVVPVTTATATATATAPTAAPVVKIASAQPSGGLLSNALRHLAPVSKAEAAPVAREAEATGDEWGIQIGAFKVAAAAEEAARHVAHLASLRGKPPEVVPPNASERPRVYRARLLHFSQKGAAAACAELHRHGIACTVLRPAALRA